MLKMKLYYYAALLTLYLVEGFSLVSALASEPKPPTVMAWLASPFGFWGGKYNQTLLDEFIVSLRPAKEYVDIISVVSYALHDPAALSKGASGLDLLENGDKVIEALLKDGWNVEPLVGDYYGNANHKIEWYRHYIQSDVFFNAVLKEVALRNVTGINFDFEPQDCSAVQPPCSSSDAIMYADFLTRVVDGLAAQGLGHVRVSADTGQSALADTTYLSKSKATTLACMNTYGSFSDFQIALKRDIAREGPDQFGLGISPSYTKNATEVNARFDLAISAGVREIDVWSGVNYSPVWVDGIKRWKKAVSGKSS